MNADQRGGGNVYNGKPSFSIEQAAAQLGRYGTHWSDGLGQPATVTYAFREAAPAAIPDGAGGFEPFDANQIRATELALARWADVANIRFVRVGSGDGGGAAYSNDATILFGNYTTGKQDAAAFAVLPGDRASGAAQGDVWINGNDADNRSPFVGSYGFTTLLHEIGHAIGLLHPSDYDEGQAGEISYRTSARYYEDSAQYTLMSYFDPSNTVSSPTLTFQSPFTPLLDDVAAIQRLYGANTASHLGDDTYSVSFGQSIWDAGGTDTLDFSTTFQNQILDLRGGSFSDVGGFAGGLSIALGTVVENAKGGAGNDRIVGNDAGNVLTGNGGNDVLQGFSGTDTYVGGDGSDRAMLGGNVRDYDLVDGGADALLLQARNGSGSIWIDPSTDVVQFQNGQYLAYGDVRAYVERAATGGVTTLAARVTGDVRVDGGAGADWLFVDGTARDYVLRRGQLTDDHGQAGDFVLVKASAAGDPVQADVVRIGEAIDVVRFRDGQYLSLRDIPAFVPGSSYLERGGAQNDLLFQDGADRFQIFVGDAGNDTLLVRGNAHDYAVRSFVGTSEPVGGARGGLELVATNGSGSLFVDASVETVQFANGQYLSLNDVPAYLAAAPQQGRTAHVVTHDVPPYALGTIRATGSTDTVYVNGTVGDYSVSRGTGGEFVLTDGCNSSQVRMEQGIDTIQFDDGRYLSVTDLPAYMRAGSFTRGTAQDDILWLGANGDQYVLGRDGIDNVYLHGNVGDYAIRSIEDVRVPYDPYAFASIGTDPNDRLSGYELMARNGSGDIYVDRSTDIVHFQNGQYLSFADLPAYIAG